MPKTLKSYKGILGKLLATENIRIEYRSVETAMFDVDGRVLVLPLWKDMSSDVLDLFLGHEVGHALFTPPAGWNAKFSSVKHDIFHHIQQTVEDVRIERKIKAKYPGLVKPMYRGYGELVEANFFGCTYADMPYLPFLDRLNVHYKLGERAGVEFTGEEQPLVDRLDRVYTWEEAEQLITDIWEVVKNEIGDYQTAFKTPVSDSNESLRVAKKRKMIASGSSGFTEKMKKWMKKALNDEVESFTFEHFEKHSKTHVDKGASVEYLTLPTFDLSEYVVGFELTHKWLVEELDEWTTVSRMEKHYQKFMDDQKATVNYLAKEFELRKNAKQRARAVSGKTGELDMDRIWKHRFSADLFVQKTFVPGGKSHGMIMILDMSGSMVDCIRNTMEQIIVLTMFCRRVGIPFEVYGFLDNNNFHYESKEMGVSRYNRSDNLVPGDLAIENENFRMKQLLSSHMTPLQYRTAISNLLSAVVYLSEDRLKLESMGLCGTPLSSALAITQQLVEKFQERTRCEIITTIVLTDGDGNIQLHQKTNQGVSALSRGKYLGLIDKRHRLTYVTERVWNIQTIQSMLLNRIRETTGSRILGFYLVSSRFRKMIQKDPMIVDLDAAWALVLKNRFHLSSKEGYDKFYLIPTNKLDLEPVEWVDVSQVDNHAVRQKMLTVSLRKIQKQKLVAKSFLNSFIQNIS